MHRIVWVSLSAALISARLAGFAQAAYTEEDFLVIEEMIEDGNWVNLRLYLTENPDLLIGDDPFTVELRKFLANTSSLYTALIFDPSLFPDLSKSRPVRTANNTLAQLEPPSRALPLPSISESQIY